jgi:hypothetical protein
MKENKSFQPEKVDERWEQKVERWFPFAFALILTILFTFIPMAGYTGLQAVWQSNKLLAIFLESVLVVATGSFLYFGYKKL